MTVYPLFKPVNQRTIIIYQVQLHRHLSNRMRGAGETRVIGPDRHLNLVEECFAQTVSVKILVRDLADRLVHCLVVIGRGHDQAGFIYNSLVVDFVMVKERAAWCFNYAGTKVL